MSKSKERKTLEDLKDEEFIAGLQLQRMLPSLHLSMEHGPSADNARSLVQKKETFAFKIGGVLYVPHYTLHGIYVGPGNRQLDESMLRQLGARETQMPLWARPR